MQIQNPVVGQIIREQNFLTVSDGFPQNLAPNVQTVLDATPRKAATAEILAYNQSTASGSMGVSLPGTSRQRLFLTGMAISRIKDAACDVASGFANVTVTIKGLGTRIAQVPNITLTAQQFDQFMVFNPPIELDPGSSITYPGTFTAGVMQRQIVAYGFVMDKTQ